MLLVYEGMPRTAMLLKRCTWSARLMSPQCRFQMESRITRSSPMSAVHERAHVVRRRWTDCGTVVRRHSGTRPEAAWNEYGSRHLILMVCSLQTTIATPEPPRCALGKEEATS